MADLKKLAEDASTNAMIAAGRDAAKRAARDLLSTDEERAANEAERAQESKAKRRKLILMGVLGLFVVIGVLGMLVSYWHWFLGAGVLGLAGWWGLRKLRRGRAAAKEIEPAPVEAALPPAVEKRQRRVDPEIARREAEAAALRERRAEEEARALAEQETDEELAALKARLGK